jgi:hypothetical protein
MAWDMHPDLAAYFVWKQVRLVFPSLALRLVDARRRVVHVASSWRLCRVHVEDGQVDATDCVRPCYPCFAVFVLLDPSGIVVF